MSQPLCPSDIRGRFDQFRVSHPGRFQDAVTLLKLPRQRLGVVIDTRRSAAALCLSGGARIFRKPWR
ncbi:hypothetical protein I6F11_05355 [Ensifer sp. NBAIM29]|nr:hypothetical protein [Ensifer sp. NBAIM29]